MASSAKVGRCVVVRFRCRRPGPDFVGFRFPAEVILLAARWYARYGLSHKDVEGLLAERGTMVDHITIYRRVWPTYENTHAGPRTVHRLKLPTLSGNAREAQISLLRRGNRRGHTARRQSIVQRSLPVCQAGQ